MKQKSYSGLWLVFVNMKPQKGLRFIDLVELEEPGGGKKYTGTWANLLIKTKTIGEALEIAPRGLKEKKFEIIFIDKISNFESLVEYGEVENGIIQEANQLLKSGSDFMISGEIFPYTSLK